MSNRFDCIRFLLVLRKSEAGWWTKWRNIKRHFLRAKIFLAYFRFSTMPCQSMLSSSRLFHRVPRATLSESLGHSLFSVRSLQILSLTANSHSLRRENGRLVTISLQWPKENMRIFCYIAGIRNYESREIVGPRTPLLGLEENSAAHILHCHSNKWQCLI